MEFLLLLGRLDKEIIDLIKESNYTIKENSTICLIDKRYIGFHNKTEKNIVICTENAKKIGNFSTNKYSNNNDNFKTKLYIRRALRHEATHMAQACNNGNLTGFIKNLRKKIHKSKLNALKLSGKLSKNSLREIEAYVMEDKAKLVKKAIRKYCL